MRNFQLVRDRDVSGVSGTGIVAEGTQFTDGTCVMRWTVGDKPNSTAIYSHIDDLVEIHGHEGATKVVFVHYGC